MYIQKITNVSRILPSACECSGVAPSIRQWSGPKATKQRSPTAPPKPPANKYTPKTVDDHVGSRDMSQSNAKNVKTKATGGSEPTATLRSLFVTSRLGARSCLRE